MDCNAADILQQETFKKLSKELLEKMLHRHHFFTPKVQIFLAFQKWNKHKQYVDQSGDSLIFVSLSFINVDHLFQVYRKSSGIADPSI